MSGAVTQGRWQEAVAAEGAYWSAVARDPREFARIVAEKVDAAEWFESADVSLPDGDWAEIGTGQYGVGCVHFLTGAAGRTLVGVEPLPPLDAGTLELPSPLVAVVEACHALPYRQVVATGEESGLEEGSCAFVCCYNVLDQARDPAALLAEAHRLLRPGGRLLLGCNTTSALSRARARLQARGGSLGLTAHTFRFSAADVLDATRRAGFTIVRVRSPRRSGLVGRADRILVDAARGGTR